MLPRQDDHEKMGTEGHPERRRKFWVVSVVGGFGSRRRKLWVVSVRLFDSSESFEDREALSCLDEQNMPSFRCRSALTV